MENSRLCCFAMLILMSFCVDRLNCGNATAAKADVGVILDLNSTLGKMCRTCISMAIEDRNSNRDHTTMIVPHFRDSRGDVVAAASAAMDLLKNTQVVAILGPQKSVQADFVIDIGDRMRVPIISPATSPALSLKESPYFIRSAWCSSSQAKAIAAIVKAFGWKEVVLVYENSNYGSGLLPYLTVNLLQSNVVVSNLSFIPPYAKDDQVLQELYNLMDIQTRVFIVHMPPDLASRFFQMAKEVGMMTEGYAWVISDPLTSLLSSVDSVTTEPMQGVLGVKAYVPRSEEVRIFTKRWSKRFHEENPNIDRTELNVFGLWAYDSTTALSEAIERVGVPSQRVNRGNSALAPILRNFTSKGLSGDFNITNGQLQPSAFEIVNVIGKGDNTVGFWTEKYGISKELELNDDKPVYSTDKDNLRGILWPGQTSNVPKGWEFPTSGKKLRVGVPVKKGFKEFIKVVRNQETNDVEASGFCIDVFEEAIRSMPYGVLFEYIPFEPTDRRSAGYYDDLVYQIYLDKYDAVVGDVTILANRSKYVDFTITYTESGFATVVPIKDDERKNAWIVMKPLTTSLWLTIGAFFIFIGCVVWVLEHRVNKHFQGPPGQQVGMIFWFSFSTLVYAHREKVKSNLTRFVVIVWVFVVLVLTSSYTANLASMLTIQQLKSTDMIKKGEYVGFQTEFLISGFSNSIIFGYYNFRNYKSSEEYDEALSKGSRNGGVAAIVDEIPYLRLFLSKYCHKYTMINPKHIETSGFGFAFRKGSPLVSDFSTAILNLKKDGKIDMITRRWLGAEGCSADGLESLHLDRFTGLFLIAGLSASTALAIFFSTFLYQNQHILASSGSIKKKLHDLARAFFVKEKDDTSKHSETSGEIALSRSPSIKTSGDKDEGLSTIQIEMHEEDS